MLIIDKITEIFSIAYDFCQHFAIETAKQPKLPTGKGKRRHNRSCEMSYSEIITILMLYHFGDFKNFKHYYLHYICVYLKK